MVAELTPYGFSSFLVCRIARAFTALARRARSSTQFRNFYIYCRNNKMFPWVWHCTRTRHSRSFNVLIIVWNVLYLEDYLNIAERLEAMLLQFKYIVSHFRLETLLFYLPYSVSSFTKMFSKRSVWYQN